MVTRNQANYNTLCVKFKNISVQ